MLNFQYSDLIPSQGLEYLHLTIAKSCSEDASGFAQDSNKSLDSPRIEGSRKDNNFILGNALYPISFPPMECLGNFVPEKTVVGFHDADCLWTGKSPCGW